MTPSLARFMDGFKPSKAGAAWTGTDHLAFAVAILAPLIFLLLPSQAFSETGAGHWSKRDNENRQSTNRSKSVIRVLVIGRTGQVAGALATMKPSTAVSYHCLGRPVLDLTKPETIAPAFNLVEPHIVVNAAAYTAVDKAESEPELARQINTEGPAHIAQNCAEAGIPLIHLSTDYVFDGTGTRPYRPQDTVNPQNVYGVTKELGERAVRSKHNSHIILRTAWVYSERGQNFVKTMLRLAGERDELSVVDDQVGTPTYAADIATAIDTMVKQLTASASDTSWGTYHVTSSGHTTWYDFAREIFKLAELHGIKIPVVSPISTEDYPTPAARPRYSVLDTTAVRDEFEISLPAWEASLKRCVENILTGGRGAA